MSNTPQSKVDEHLARSEAMRPHITQYEIAELKSFMREMKLRQVETLKLYEPLTWQDKFHASTAKECILSKGNQAGGSVTGFVEVARAVTGQDPYNKYPKENGVAVCLGYGEPHIGRVMHRYLFGWDAFKIIRDEETGEWRTFRPWDPDEDYKGIYGDAHRKDEARPAPPFIPRRFIKGKIAWVKNAERIFSRVEFINGWKLYACNSNGDPSQAQGFQANLYHIDEDVAKGGWYTEAVARCSVHEGLIRWTAMPHAKTEDIVNMITRAEEDEGKETPETVCIRASIFDNPYLPKKSREMNMRIWRDAGEDVVKMRAYGELTSSAVRMYPFFDKRTHSAIRVLSDSDRRDEEDGIEVRHGIQKILTESNGIPPHDWCRYFSMDPGHQILGGVMIAVPPPELGDFKIAYNELYIHQANASVFGKKLYDEARREHFHDFIADMHGGRLRQLGSGELPIRDYERQLDKYNLRCEVRGSRFAAGCDDIKLREGKLRNWISTRDDGYPTLLVVADRCPNLVKEITRFKKKTGIVNGVEVVLDEGNRRGPVHAVECLEMLAAHGCAYVKPPMRVKESSRVDRILAMERSFQAKMSQQSPRSNFINLGPRGE